MKIFKVNRYLTQITEVEGEINGSTVKVNGKEPPIWNGGYTHIYCNTLEQARGVIIERIEMNLARTRQEVKNLEKQLYKARLYKFKL